MIKLLTLFSLIWVSPSLVSASECEITGLKVQDRLEITRDGQKTFLYVVGDLEKSFSISENASKELKNHLEKSYDDHRYTFDLRLSGMGCSSVERNKGTKRVIHVVPSAFYRGVSHHNFTEDHDCIECLSLNNAPVMFDLPSMSDINKVLNEAVGLSDDDVRIFTKNLYDDFNSMDFKTPQANTIILLTNLIERFAELGLERIDNFQIDYLIQILKDDVPEQEWQFMKKVVAKIDLIQFERIDHGRKTIARVNVQDQKIKIGPQDIPTKNDEERELLEKHLGSIIIHDNTSFVITNREQNRKDIKLRGVEMNGLFPIIGRVALIPRNFTIAPNERTPVKAVVRIKKGISYSHEFHIDF